MSLRSFLDWHWRARTVVPAAQAAVAWGAVAVALLERLRGAMPPPAGEGGAAAMPALALSVCATQDLLVVLGPEQALPWVEGIAYAAPCAQAAALWCPTWQEPDVCADLLARALLRRVGGGSVLLWPQPRVALPLGRQFPLDAATLARIARRWGLPDACRPATGGAS